MVLESTVICVDSSDYQRNGDYVPTRLSIQKDCAQMICMSKIRSNPENNVGLLTMSDNVEVLVTLTADVGRILSKLHLVQPKGAMNLLTAIRIAHLVLKHRQGKNHKMRIVIFVGSPIRNDEVDFITLAKRLKKEKVCIDLINFGEHETNLELLTTFVNALNGKGGTGSHLLNVPRGSGMSQALLASPIIKGEDGLGGAGLGSSGYEFGIDPNEDPELALALRLSMEEDRYQQEEERRRALQQSNVEAGNTGAIAEENSEEAMLRRALAMSEETPQQDEPNFANMSEEEQIAFAMQMSMQDAAEEAAKQTSPPTIVEIQSMDVDVATINEDNELLQNVLGNLPGVDPESEEVRDAIGALNKDKDRDNDNKANDESDKN